MMVASRIQPLMNPEEILVQESQARSRQMAVAGVAGVLLLVAAIVNLTGPHAKVNELTLGLIVDHQRGPLDIIVAVINAIAQIAIAWTLVYLFRSARLRSERAQGFIPILAMLGAGLSVVAGVLNAVVISIKVHDFVTTGAQTYDEANRLTGGSGLLILQIAAQLASLFVAIAFVLVALQAMRVGLLPRFLGYVGMISGALVLFPIIVLPVVQFYWLLAVGYLLSGRWPSGLPAAWRTGRAEALPSSTEVRARRVAEAEAARGARGARGSRRRGRGAPAEDAAPAATVVEDDAAPRQRTANQKRKRKRRR
jgi:hypothetical protein